MVHVPETIITIKLVAHFEASTVLAFGRVASCCQRAHQPEPPSLRRMDGFKRDSNGEPGPFFFEKQPLDQSIELRMAAVQVKTKLCGNFVAWTLRMGGGAAFFDRREPYQIDQRATTA